MRLLCSEFRKLFSNRLFIVCFVLFFIVNSVGLCFFSVSNESNKYELNVSDRLKEELSYYLDMDRDDAIDTLSIMKEAYQIASNIQSASSTNVEPSYIAELIEQYSQESPEAYKCAQKIIDNGFSSEDIYYRIII